MHTLNIGILAHVDAGKTSLTERLLHHAGVIDELGSVDGGDTQTDTMTLERRRGITIRSAVMSLVLDGVAVNLVDTPGHPDFIAEVERTLGVLDGAVLVVSAVEGVQAQTRLLMRALRRLGVPTLIFVNKIDRAGADYAGTLDDIAARLTSGALAMGRVSAAGTPTAAFHEFGARDAAFRTRLVDVLAAHDDRLLARYVRDESTVSYRHLRDALARQTARARAHPVFFGSAITGAGVHALAGGIRRLLPTPQADPGGPVSGTVFKIERGTAGEKVAYLRMFSGTIRVRDRITVGGDAAKVTAIGVFDRGPAVARDAVTAGHIGKLWGLTTARIGDVVGQPRSDGAAVRHFPPPTLETVVQPSRPQQRGALHAALTHLAEQDPLIDVRIDEERREIAVSLYGEVQKEVVQATLADEYGIDVEFRETTTICVERPTGEGAAVEFIGAADNPFLATVGLRVQPAPPGTGTRFGLEVELGSMPVAFFRAVEETVHATLRQGLSGWTVLDCAVTMTHAGYWARQSHAHATFDKSMSSVAGDFRGLTPLVLMAALARAGTAVHEPLHRFRLEAPADTVAGLLLLLGRLRAVPLTQLPLGTSIVVVEGEIPAARVHALHRRLPGLTRGEGVLETAFDRHQPVPGEPPSRPRWGPDPLDRAGYLRLVTR